ncbi:hypothetical protein N824_15200 [Pedobacter sp. V48]|nr:VOC family protein [Pedobacter sp. V48]ETZ23882.1 hypothetical protein N824_15200 [Pedobacter sp. V48]
MKALSSATVIHVSDYSQALKYYTEILGFSIDSEYGQYAGLSKNEACIHINGPANPGRKNPLVTPIWSLTAMPWTLIIWISLKKAPLFRFQ